MFIKNKEKKIIEKKFINQGYLIKKVDSKNSLNWITKEYLSFLKKKLNIKKKLVILLISLTIFINLYQLTS